MNKITEYLSTEDTLKLSKSTQESYRFALQHCENFYKESNTKLEIHEFIHENFVSFVNHLDQLKISGKSVQQYITNIKIFLKWAGLPVEYTYKISNEERQANKRKHLDRWFNEKEINLCLSYNFPRQPYRMQLAYKIIIKLLVETGARVREISNIKRNDIDIEEMWVIIQGKTEPRPVFFSPETQMLIKEYLDFYKGVNLFPEVNKIKSVVTTMLGDLKLKSHRDGRGSHTFRHYTASYLYYTGEMEIADIAYLLGDKAETIRDIYIHPTPKMLKARVSKAMGWEI